MINMKPGSQSPDILFRICLFILISFPSGLLCQQNPLAYVGGGRILEMGAYSAGIQEYTIPYKGKLPLDPGTVSALAACEWIISGTDFTQSGQGGEELSDYMFQIPGDYVVEIIPLSGSPDPPSNSCGENVVPTLLFVSVQPYAFIIDTGTITYSH